MTKPRIKPMQFRKLPNNPLDWPLQYTYRLENLIKNNQDIHRACEVVMRQFEREEIERINRENERAKLMTKPDGLTEFRTKLRGA